ncbi:MAG: zf-HC2 domain-containing protein, partial [Bryobacteraceae bacterium]
MTCERIRPDLALYVYGELSFDQEEAFEQHFESCAECRAELDVLRSALERVDSAEIAPPPGLAAACRRDLMAAIHAEAGPSRRSRWSRLSSLWNPVWMRPVGALALLVLGFAGGRLLPSKQEVAAAPASLRVRNVTAGPGDEVRISLDETHRREVTGSVHDGKIRDLLVAATQGAPDAGLR